ncbi:Hypothetical protein EMIHUDRAFT_220284 [Emiliania huxleyi CCMP1516]|uniref:U-box domain-containing protein n=2 Tax=Emiliania huxleyi TaxID=2903 RepID=A0A0D3I1N3_EMIH1|nr:Hypothetical protein EMIHUDRAFT_220284 [Emiliania huxleyi CCMP1516]EOD05168.1 Hypothetical protein EMIHUDRAFT_220284 [Emiliania huxleyi CCMP1516]|eukprot:XP_005757597.1 Hypothetical protein EMIHUDRAFT_220284 [Emiliania huxleyi CCMP1516]
MRQHEYYFIVQRRLARHYCWLELLSRPTSVLAHDRRPLYASCAFLCRSQRGEGDEAAPPGARPVVEERTLVAATEGGSPSAAEAPAAKEEEPPADFICPITTEIMVEPVVAADGQSYERTAIERWLATKSTSPLTGGELEHSILIPNHNLRRTIREWQEARTAL